MEKKEVVVYPGVNYGDFVKCTECGKLMLLPLTSERCPECGAEDGQLVWAKGNEANVDLQEMYLPDLIKDGYNLVHSGKDLKITDYHSKEFIEEEGLVESPISLKMQDIMEQISGR